MVDPNAIVSHTTTISPQWLQALSALAALVVAYLVYRVARDQRKLSREKLRLDLFDKRYEVYLIVWEFIEKVLHSRYDESLAFEFRQKTRQVDFLFKSDVIDYIEEIISLYQEKTSLMDERRARENTMPQDELRKIQDRQVEIDIHLSRQGEVLIDKFKPYLHFADK